MYGRVANTGNGTGNEVFLVKISILNITMASFGQVSQVLIDLFIYDNCFESFLIGEGWRKMGM